MLDTNQKNSQKNNLNRESDQFIIFTLQDKEFGINVLDSREIITAGDLTTIPESPNFVKGVINLRDQIIPIIDLNKRFKLQGEMDHQQDKVIIISVNNTLIGLGVKEVKEILRIDPDNISEAPEITKGVDKNYIQGIARMDARLLILIDIEKIFSESEIDKLQDLE